MSARAIVIAIGLAIVPSPIADPPAIAIGISPAEAASAIAAQRALYALRGRGP